VVDLGEALAQLEVRDDQARARVTQDMLEFAGAIAIVDREVYGADAIVPEENLEQLEPCARDNGHAIARRDAEPKQQPRVAARALVELAPGPASAFVTPHFTRSVPPGQRCEDASERRLTHSEALVSAAASTSISAERTKGSSDAASPGIAATTCCFAVLRKPE